MITISLSESELDLIYDSLLFYSQKLSNNSLLQDRSINCILLHNKIVRDMEKTDGNCS